MEAQTVPREAAAARQGMLSPRVLRLATDARLIALVREGNAPAFEAIYDRYQRPIMSFCRHMLGDHDEAADAVQHTFLAAYNAIVSSNRPILLRAWLFTIARNRCYSILRARREQPASEVVEPSTEGLAAEVQRREDLRQLLADMRRLPDDQRAALVLAELGTLSHHEIAAVLGVPQAKVKALVFQARESLIASRAARDTDCTEIRRQLSTLSGAALRRGNLRRHLRLCPACREFRSQVELQRRGLAAVLPVVPSLALKEAILCGVPGTSTAAGALAGGGLLASTAIKSLALKGLVFVFALLGTAGTIAAVHALRSAPGVHAAGARGVVAARLVVARAPVSRHGRGVAGGHTRIGAATAGSRASVPGVDTRRAGGHRAAAARHRHLRRRHVLHHHHRLAAAPADPATTQQTSNAPSTSSSASQTLTSGVNETPGGHRRHHRHRHDPPGSERGPGQGDESQNQGEQHGAGASESQGGGSEAGGQGHGQGGDSQAQQGD